MNSTMIQEIITLKKELYAAKKYIQELEIIKAKYLKSRDYEISVMSEHMPEGPAKTDFINMMLKMM